MASPILWTWVWVNARSWWWTGKPSMLPFMGSQRVGHDWATELSWTELNYKKNTGSKLIDIHLGNDFFRSETKAKVVKVKIKKQDSSNSRASAHWRKLLKETINKMKRQPIELEQILAYPTADKRLISKIYEEFIQLNSKKIIQLKNEWSTK